MNKYDVAESVHVRVNINTEYRTDLIQYGVPEFWEANGKYGDCEDYALSKRNALLQAGWYKDKLNLACCWTETGDYHCVLLVDTDSGWYALDNRHDSPMRPSTLGYTWDKALREDGKWYTISF